LLQQFQGFSEINSLIEETHFESGTILKINPIKDDWDEDSIKRLFDNLEVLNPPSRATRVCSTAFFSTRDIGEFGQVNSAYYDDFDYKISAKYFIG